MKKLFGVLFITLALPLFGALSTHEPQAFNSIAVAGRSVVGGAWCQCGCDLCECFPNEVPMACGGNRASGDGGGVMLLLFALALAARFALRR